jgi:hypothetical protein
METLIVYVNDSEYARNQLATMINARQPTKCVLVGCPPKLNRHISRWISGGARKKWQTQWSETACAEISQAFVSEGHQFVNRVAFGPLINVTKQLQGEFLGARVLDARRPKLAQTPEPIVEGQQAQPDLVSTAMGVAATTAILALAAD